MSQATKIFAGLALLLVFAFVHTTDAASQSIEIEIWNTADEKDDYLTWAPAPARIRQAAESAQSDLAVVLTNDPMGPIPSDRLYPLDGDLAFDAAVSPGQTADQDELALVLPQDGSWVEFVVAGKYPRASSADKDAVILVHEERAEGPVLSEKKLMVRIRKDHRTFTDGERKRFLEALAYMHWTAKTPQGKGLYREFVRLHTVAAGPMVRPYGYADLAHKGPGFIAWHRAFLLQFERALQAEFPDVTLPYWTLSEESELFDEHFLGGNDIIPDVLSRDAELHATNPLFGWNIDGAAIPRWTIARSGSILTQLFDTEAELLQRTTYSNYPGPITPTTGFADRIERNPHNTGHGWVGAWMNSCQTSPRDPIFWVFHTGFDRQWARWQYRYDKLDPTGGGGSYHPAGKFETQGASEAQCNALFANECTPIGHNAEDTMWPWNDKFGQGATVKGSLPPPGLLQLEIFFENFPPAAIPTIWPSTPTKPRPIDMIDYAGISPPQQDMGFAYDDVPYGAQSPEDVVVMADAENMSDVSAFVDKTLSARDRLSAISKLDASSLEGQDDVDFLLKVLNSNEEPAQLRRQALMILQQRSPSEWVESAIAVVELEADGPNLEAVLSADEPVKVDAIHALMSAAMFTADGRARDREIFAAIRNSLDDTRRPVQIAIIQAMAPMGDAATLEYLANVLEDPSGKSLSVEDALQGIRLSTQQANYHPVIRQYLKSDDDMIVEEALRSLAGDQDSEDQIAHLARNKSRSKRIRSAALGALAGGSAGALVEAARSVMGDGDDVPELRAEAAAALGVYLRANADDISPETASDLADAFGALVSDSDQTVATLAKRGQNHAKRLISK